MPEFNRRQVLTWFALAPTVPAFLTRSAHASAAQAARTGNDRVVVVVRMLGGNDGLNTVVPVRDDRYYQNRPTIALPRRDTIALPGDLGLHPALSDLHALMDAGRASIIQGVGYPTPSRSHSRSTEIWEAGSLADPAPAEGWLGRYLDHHCECGPDTIAGLQFGTGLDRTLAARQAATRAVGHTQLLLDLPKRVASRARTGARPSRLDYLLQVENGLSVASRQLHQASRGTGRSFDYPDTSFGQSLRWTGDMIETGSATRAYYVTIGSFDGPTAASFDTHVDQLDKHRLLYTELGRGLRAFAAHLQRSGQLDRVLLLTFSDFGRQVAENRTRGTDHGDASLLFLMGGGVRAGLHGTPADLGAVHDGGLDATLDFRRVYADVLQRWLQADPVQVLGASVEPYPIVAG